jgi:hypothetical protein
MTFRNREFENDHRFFFANKYVQSNLCTMGPEKHGCYAKGCLKKISGN